MNSMERNGASTTTVLKAAAMVCASRLERWFIFGGVG